MNVLLSALDNGRVTNSKGPIVNFSNAVLITTSNLGAKLLIAAMGTDKL